MNYPSRDHTKGNRLFLFFVGTNTYPEDGVNESINNLETWQVKQGLEFCINHDDNTLSLIPIDSGSGESQA